MPGSVGAACLTKNDMQVPVDVALALDTVCQLDLLAASPAVVCSGTATRGTVQGRLRPSAQKPQSQHRAVHPDPRRELRKALCDGVGGDCFYDSPRSVRRPRLGELTFIWHRAVCQRMVAQTLPAAGDGPSHGPLALRPLGSVTTNSAGCGRVIGLGTVHARDKPRANDALISLALHCTAACRTNARVSRVLDVQGAHNAPTTRDRAPAVVGPSGAPQVPQTGSGFECMAALAGLEHRSPERRR